jgi:hypothetical protein
MSEPTADPLAYYATHGPLTDPGEGAWLFEGLPHDVGALCEIVQGAPLHVFWVERYSVRISPERAAEVELRHQGVPAVIRSYTDGGVQQIQVATEQPLAAAVGPAPPADLGHATP